MAVQGEIAYLLSEKGRRDSLLKGGSGHKVQRVTGPVTEQDLPAFVVDDEGRVFFDARTNVDAFLFSITLPDGKGTIVPRESEEEIYWDVVPDWNDLVGIARQLKTQHDAKDSVAEREQQRRDEIAKNFVHDSTARATRIEKDYVLIDGERFESWTVIHEAKKRWTQDQEDLKTRNRATLAEWISIHGSENQRQRLTAGVLPWKEAYDTVDEYLYKPLEDFPPYRRFDAQAVCNGGRNTRRERISTLSPTPARLSLPTSPQALMSIT